MPAEPAIRLVPEELRQHFSGSSGTQLHTTDRLSCSAPMPGRTDGKILDAIAIDVAGSHDHSSKELARLSPGPVPQELPGRTGVDVDISWALTRLVAGAWCAHDDLAAAVTIEIRDPGN